MNEKEEKEYLIPLEDIPAFMNRIGISLPVLSTFLMKTMAFQTKETLDNFKDAVTPEQYAKTIARFNQNGKTYKMIVSYSFDRLFYAKIQYAVLRYGEKTVKGKDGKKLGEYADNMKKNMTDINFDEPLRLTQKNIDFLKEDMRLNFKSKK